MHTEHERKWKVPFGLVELPSFDLHIIGDTYLASPTEPVLRMRKMMSFTDSEPRPRGDLEDQDLRRQVAVHGEHALREHDGSTDLQALRPNQVDASSLPGELLARDPRPALERDLEEAVLHLAQRPEDVGVRLFGPWLSPGPGASRVHAPPEEVTGVAEYSNRALLRGPHGRS